MNQNLEWVGKTPAEAIAEADNAFVNLAADSSLYMTGDFDLREILKHFQQKHWGAFNWAPLQEGPPSWQVVVTRQSPPKTKRGIEEFLTQDHHRCDDIFIELENTSQGGQLEKVASLFAAFATGMEHHFAMEEGVFFPAFEAKTGMTQGPTMVMRMEHQQMRGLIKQMDQAKTNQDTSALGRGISTLMVLMRQHNIKEEQMLYRMGEMHLASEADDLVRKMQAR